MNSMVDYLRGLPARRRMQLVGVLFIPLFILQAMNLMTWIAAEPIGHLEDTGLHYDAIPEDAKSYYLSSGNIQFNQHGVIGDEPLVFLCWVLLFIGTFIAYVLVQNAMKKTGG